LLAASANPATLTTSPINSKSVCETTTALTISASILGIPASKTRTVRTRLVLFGSTLGLVGRRKYWASSAANIAGAGGPVNGPLGPAKTQNLGLDCSDQPIRPGGSIGIPFGLSDAAHGETVRRQREPTGRQAI
jgi:hypothetical protein